MAFADAIRWNFLRGDATKHKYNNEHNIEHNNASADTAWARELCHRVARWRSVTTSLNDIEGKETLCKPE